MPLWGNDLYYKDFDDMSEKEKDKIAGTYGRDVFSSGAPSMAWLERAERERDELEKEEARRESEKNNYDDDRETCWEKIAREDRETFWEKVAREDRERKELEELCYMKTYDMEEPNDTKYYYNKGSFNSDSDSSFKDKLLDFFTNVKIIFFGIFINIVVFWGIFRILKFIADL